MPREKIFDKLIPVMFRLEPAQLSALKQVSKTNKVSASEYLRRMIDKYIIEAGKEGGKPDGFSKDI